MQHALNEETKVSGAPIYKDQQLPNKDQVTSGEVEESKLTSVMTLSTTVETGGKFVLAEQLLPEQPPAHELQKGGQVKRWPEDMEEEGHEDVGVDSSKRSLKSDYQNLIGEGFLVEYVDLKK
jgi:hypothetical protein